MKKSRIAYAPLAKLKAAQRLQEEKQRFRAETGISGEATPSAIIRGRATNVGRRVSSGAFSALRSFQNFANVQRQSRTGYSGGGRRGRPRGTYDRRYAAYGGVYGFRKMLAQQIRERKMQAQSQLAIPPEQAAAMQEIARRRMEQQQNPENKVIVDTTGVVKTKSIHQEIDDAANIFP